MPKGPIYEGERKRRSNEPGGEKNTRREKKKEKEGGEERGEDERKKKSIFKVHTLASGPRHSNFLRDQSGRPF